MRFENTTPETRREIVNGRQNCVLVIGKEILGDVEFSDRPQFYPSPSPTIPIEVIKKGLMVSEVNIQSVWTNFHLDILNNRGSVSYRNILVEDNLDTDEFQLENDCLVSIQFT